MRFNSARGRGNGRERDVRVLGGEIVGQSELEREWERHGRGRILTRRWRGRGSERGCGCLGTGTNSARH